MTRLPIVMFGVAALFSQVSMAGVRQLSLREAVAIALERNPELTIETIQLEAATAAFWRAKGAFDPVLRIDLNRRAARNPATSVLDGANGRVDIKEWRQRAALRQQLPWSGMSWEAGFETNRISTTNPFTSLNPYFEPRATLGLTIPLARFRATDRDRTEIQVRQKQLILSDAEFEQKLISLVSRVESAYWAWVAARANRRAAGQLVALAQEALASTERLIQEGELADADRFGTLGLVKRRSEDVAAADVEASRAESGLKMLLTVDASDSLWQDHLSPTDLTAPEIGVDLAGALQAAAKGRPELRIADVQRETALLQARLADEARKPAVDLVAAYTSQGLGGREAPGAIVDFPGFPPNTVPPFLIGGLGAANRQLFRNRFPTYQVGISIELPLRNRSADAQMAQAELAVRRAKLERTQLEKLIALDVRQAYAALDRAKSRIEFARASADSARRRLESELRLLREGQASNLNVNVRQNELAESEQLAVATERDFNLSHAEARRATSQLLDFFGVKIR